MLKEAEHRSTFYIPYWNLPLAGVLVPRQRRFRADLAVINACLDGLIGAPSARGRPLTRRRCRRATTPRRAPRPTNTVSFGLAICV